MSYRSPMEHWYRKRFEVFERDRFTCQYCGQRAPNVMLEVDHKIEVAAGGTDDPENLITSCIACNRGKGALFSYRRFTHRTNGAAAYVEKPPQPPRLIDDVEAVLLEHGPLPTSEIARYLRRNEDVVRVQLNRCKGKQVAKEGRLWHIFGNA